MSVADIESTFTARAAQFSELNAKIKFDLGDDRLFIDATQTPAWWSALRIWKRSSPARSMRPWRS